MSVNRTDLAKLGFHDLSASLAHLRERESAGLQMPTSAALQAFADTADPDAALRACRQIGEAAWSLCDTSAWPRLLRLVGASSGFADFFWRHPEKLAVFAACDEVLEPAAALRRAVDAAQADAAQADAAEKAAQTQNETAALRTEYRMLSAVIAEHDLRERAPEARVDVVWQQLSDLADAALEVGLQISRQIVAERSEVDEQDLDSVQLAVIAMGKCGARELNYVSDVDVIYVADIPEGMDEQRGLSLATRLASGLAKVISAAGTEPALWPLDANLRPEGKAGALVRTLASHLAYYERWAEDWEFQALLKARCAAGDRVLGRAYVEGVRKLVWSRARQPGFVTSVRRMRTRVVENIPREYRERQLKLGAGGLRDVEFTVQLLQLVHGGADDRIHARGTLVALNELASHGYVGRVEASQLDACYRMLRVLEHRLQLRRLKRTHVLPTDELELRALARAARLGNVAEDATAEWHRIRAQVRTLHTRIFSLPLLETAARSQGLGAVLLSSAAVESRLIALGYRDPRAAFAHLKALTQGVTRRAEIQRHLLPVLLDLLAQGTDPDYGLLAFRRLSDSLGETYWYLRMLRDSPLAAERLCRVLSCSHYIGDQIDRMADAAQWFGVESDLRPRTLAQIHTEMAAIAARRPRHDPGTPELLQHVRHRELLRLAISGVLDEGDVAQISAGVSDVHTALIQTLLEWVGPHERYGIGFAVIGLGRFGGREQGFGSDLDLNYVYEPEDSMAAETAQKAALSCAAQLNDALQDYRMPVELDFDLRPEGRKGALVRSVHSTELYYRRWGDIWEAQALLRARPIAGDSAVSSDYFTVIDPVRYPDALSDAEVRNIRAIKVRMESERLPRGADPTRHLKLGRGSLTDVEWLVQLRVLQHAAQHPELRTVSTLKALHSLESLSIIRSEDATTLREAWLLSSRIRSAITLFTGRSSDVLPEDAKTLAGVAEILGYPSDTSRQLVNDYLAATRRSRRIFEREFFEI